MRKCGRCDEVVTKTDVANNEIIKKVMKKARFHKKTGFISCPLVEISGIEPLTS